MTKQMVEVPDGYKIKGEGTVRSYDLGDVLCFPLEKIQPRRIVLERTGIVRQPKLYELYLFGGAVHQKLNSVPLLCECEILQQVGETDIPLTNEDANVKMGVSQGDGVEPNLELSVKELRNVRSLIKDFENLGWFINPERALLLQKITEFIKDK